jgi:membrane associated rhomboid family serine protease
MNRPKQQLTIAYIFCLVALAWGVAVRSGLQRAFESNPIFNSLILIILAVGVATSLHLLHQLAAASRWLLPATQATYRAPPALLEPIDQFARTAGQIPRNATDAVLARLDDARDLTRYFMNVLILLGLLGTFWGLLQTVGGIGSVISGLSLGDADIKEVFERFKESLQRPLSGMGVSFSASLFGLASSLILGFLDLLAARGQSAVCTELEKRCTPVQPDVQPALTGPTSGPSDSTDSARSASQATFQSALINSLTEQLERVERTLRQQGELRLTEQGNTRALQEILARIDDHLQAHHALATKLLAVHQHTTPLLEQLATFVNTPAVAALEHHARSIDLSVREIGRQVAQAAEGQTEELRTELRILAKILSQPPHTPPQEPLADLPGGYRSNGQVEDQ